MQAGRHVGFAGRQACSNSAGRHVGIGKQQYSYAGRHACRYAGR